MLNFLQNLPAELSTFIVAMIPILELRGAIPFGVILGLPPIGAFFWALLGNIFVCILILAILDPISKFLMKHSRFFNKFFTKLFENTHSKHKDKVFKYGALFLIIFVAIPLPGSGGWTGSLVAFLFGMNYWKSLGYMTIGLVLSGTIVTILTITGVSFF